MSLHVNFSTHGKDLSNAYQAVISDSDPTNWLVFSYDKGTNDLRVQGTGSGGLEELVDEFHDGKIQFAFARVIDPNTELPKYVFIAWCGSGVPETRKGFFNSHLTEVANFFKSFHVQINARDEADVEPELIMRRVAESSGAKYSVHKEQRRPQPAVTPVGSVYKKTEIPDLGAMQRETMKREGPPAPVGTKYEPVKTAPKPLGNRWNVQAQQQDSGAAQVRAERERAERELREKEEAAAREKLQKEREAEERERQRAAEQEREKQEAERRRQTEEAAAAERRRREEEEKAARLAEQKRLEEAAARAAEQQRLEEEAHEAERQRLAEIERQNAAAAVAAREEEERLKREAERQAEQESALKADLDNVADHAVHTAKHAADVTVSEPLTKSAGVSAVVLFEYTAAESNEMSLVEGEVIVNIDQVDEGWWYGVSEDGKKQGLFPANYVQVLEEKDNEPKPEVHEPTKAAAAAQPDLGQTALALYDYDAGEDNEISFKEGQLITHIEFVSEEWWQGVAADGKTVGLFPANYVELQH